MDNLKNLHKEPDPLPSMDLDFPSALTLPLNLSVAQKGVTYIVSSVAVPAGYPQWLVQLEDIGFLPGEHVAIMARGLPGGDPLVVRVGLSTFALRLVEAACVQVVPNAVTHL